MKHASLLSGLAATILGVLTLAVNAQTWETTFAPALPGTTSGHSILVDPLSNDSVPRRVFVGAGRYESEDSSSSNRLFILDRATGQYENIAGFSGARNVRRLGFEPLSRSLYAVSQSSTGWQIRKSRDGGTSWTLVDVFEVASQRIVPTDFAADEQGSVFVCGYWDDGSPTGWCWIVRRGVDQGQTWSTVESLTNSIPARMHHIPGTNGGLFVVGERRSGSGANTTYAWIIRRSRDAGATWKTVHTYTGSGNVGASAITSDGQGAIYVAGWGAPNVVKRSTDGGDTWQIIRNSPDWAGFYDMAADPLGNLYLAGGAIVLRRNSTGAWEDMGFNPDVAWAGAIAIDSAGNVLTVGSLRDPNTTDQVYSLVMQQFTVALPPLKVTPSAGVVFVSWPAWVSGAVLEATDTLDPAATTWFPVPNAPVVDGDRQSVTVDATGSASQFFRLRKQ